MPAHETGSFNEQKKLFATRMQQEEKVVRTKLMLIVVANTLDKHIGNGCKEDIKSIRGLFAELSKEMDFNFMELVVKAEDYSKENILGAIDMLTPGPNDIVVFYYSGHGFSYDKEKDKKFAQVDLRSHPSVDKIEIVNENTENLAEIFEMVKSKGARLNIVIGDCCNTKIQFERDVKATDANLHIGERPVLKVNKKTTEALFCDLTASILAGAADKGQFAISDDKIGSLFTYNFTNHLKQHLSNDLDESKGIPWQKLLEETQDKTLSQSKGYDIGEGKPGHQKPIFDIAFRRSLY
ncbi:MAG: caspase family protein [Bacteroidetes bacterium]|nr:caspase family protein [Bacteroidota bacterium]